MVGYTATEVGVLLGIAALLILATLFVMYVASGTADKPVSRRVQRRNARKH